jgi:hypothetical protein
VSGSTLGTATSTVTSGTATFVIAGISTSVQVARDLTIAVGDVAVIQRVGAIWVAIARLYPAAPAAVDSPSPPDVKPAVAAGTLVCAPVETRSYRPAGWRTDIDDVIQGQPGTSGNHTGCAFYGLKPASLTGATVTAASVLLHRPARSGNPAPQALTLWRVTETTRPSGAPTLGASTAGPSLAWDQASTYTIPTAWAQAMVDGTAGGLAVFESDGDPLVALSGTTDYGPAMTLTIDWQR